MDITEFSVEFQKAYLDSEISSIGLRNLMKYKEREVDVFFINKLNDELDRMDKNIQKKWGLESRFYLTDAENAMYGKRGEFISDSYYNSQTLADLNNESFLSDLKDIITNHAKNELEKYSNKYNLNKEIKSNIIKDINVEVDKIVNNLSEKYLNNKTRDIIENFQNKWDEAFESKDYDTANFFAGQIRRMYNKGIFKDDDLRDKNLRTIYIDDILDEKRDKGQTVELTDMEREAIDRYMQKIDVNNFMGELSNYLKS